jgi:hypothetical protein
LKINILISSLVYTTQNLLEKYAGGNLVEETFPGLKPSSNWPVSLDDLLTRLNSLSLEEMFHQPFDLEGKFQSEAEVYIQRQLNYVKSLQDQQDYELQKDYASKALQAYISLVMLQGSQLKMIECLDYLKKLQQEHSALFEETFSVSIKNSEFIIKQILEYFSGVITYPILRNYSINEFFTISKNILFAANKYSFSQCTSITSDTNGKYLYIILSGINGGMFKIGTGYDNTEKGKVYAHKTLVESEDMYQWVFCKGKLYVKQGSKEFGYVTKLNSETFENEGRIKLIFPESSQHSVIKKKNENYVLLSDGHTLSVVLLEPVLNPEMKEPPKEDKQINHPIDEDEDDDEFSDDGRPRDTIKRELSDVYTYINLMLYSYDVELSSNSKVDTKKEFLINELLETFSCFYNKEECYKALAINNWDFEKAALYLIDHGQKVREPLLIPEKSLLLFQTKLEGVAKLHSKSEFKALKNSIIDVSQYDLFKWVITKDNIIAYKLKEGTSYVFSRDANKVKDYKIKFESKQDLVDINVNVNVNQPHEGYSEYIVKGTYIITINSATLNKYDYSMCYNIQTQNYYLISSNNLISQSILVSNTFQDQQINFENNLLGELGYSSIENFKNTFIETSQKFESFYNNFYDFFLLIETKRQSLYWKFRNWNYFYTTYFNNCYNIYRDFGGKDSNKLISLCKIISPRIEKTRRINEILLMRQLGENIVDNYDLDFENKGQEKSHLKDSTKKIGIPSGAENVNWCSWGFTNKIILQKKIAGVEGDEILPADKKFGICLENKKDYFMCVEGNAKNLENILNLIKDAFKNKNNSEIGLIKSLYYLYFWVRSSDNSLLLSNLGDKKKTDSFINKTLTYLCNLLREIFESSENLKIKNLIIANIISGWEILCYDLNSQIEWFNKLLKLDSNISSINNSNSKLEDNLLVLIEGKISPMEVLIQKLILQGKNYNLNLINKVSSIKYYQFYYEGGNYYGLPLATTLNPKAFQFPFYWVLYGYSFKLSHDIKFILKSEKENQKEETILKESCIVNDYKNNLYSYGGSTFKVREEKIKNEIFDMINFSKRSINSMMVDKDLDIDNQEEISQLLKSRSEEFWQLITNEILECKPNSIHLLKYLAFSFNYIIGDMNENIEFTIPDGYSRLDKAIEYYWNRIFTFVIKNLDFAINLIKKSFEDVDLKIEEKNNIFFKNKKLILMYTSSILNFIFNRMSAYPMKLFEEYQEKLFSLLTELTKVFMENKDMFNLFSILKNYTSGGFQSEGEKNFEYSFNVNEPAQIYEKINFAGSSAVVVEIDTKSSGEKPNYDLIFISEEHSYLNQRANSNNNYANFGTCFLMKLSSTNTKRLFLPGQEIKIMTNNDWEYGRGRKISTQAKTGVKSVLKLKCYPYRNILYIYPFNAECHIKNFLLKNEMNLNDLHLWLELLNDIDFFSVYIIKKMIKSTEQMKEEKCLSENSIANIVKLGLTKYEEKDISDLVIDYIQQKKFKKIIEADKVIDKLGDKTGVKPEEKKINQQVKENALVTYVESHINSFNPKIKPYIEEVISKLKETEENKSIDFSNLLLFKFKSKIRELIPEPQNYTRLKLLPSFNSQMKSLWTVSELSFILTILYHTDSLTDAFKWITEENPPTSSVEKYEKYINPQYEFFGKKLNSLLTWMSSRVQYMKDTFDSIKIYSELIVENNNQFMQNIKELVIQKIKVLEEEKLKEKEGAKSETQIQEKKKKEPKTKPQSEINLATKTINFKKKSNVKRLFQELPPKKKKESKGGLKDIISAKEVIPKNEEEVKCTPTPTPTTLIENLDSLSLDQLFEKYSAMKLEFINKENIKKLKEDIKSKIEADVKEAYFGNIEKLRNVCEINELSFSESNLSDSLKSYTNFILSKLSKIYNFEQFENCTEMNLDEVYNNIYHDSPYAMIAEYVLEKLFFLLELNQDSSINEKIDSNNTSMVSTPKGRSMTKKITFEMKDSKELSRQGSQSITPRHDSNNMNYVVESFRKVKRWENEDELNGVPSPHQNLIRGIFNWIYKSPDTNLIRNLMNQQNSRLKIREIGMKNLMRLTGDSLYNHLSKISYNIIGALTLSLKNSITNGLEAVVRSIDIKYKELENILIYYVQFYNNEINNLLTVPKSQISNYCYLPDNKIKPSHELFIIHKIKNLNLLLSDINIILSYMTSIPCESSSFPLSLIQNFIQRSLKIIIYEETKNNSKVIRMILDFTENLKSALGKFITFSKNSGNHTVTDYIIEGLFSSLDLVINDCDNQVVLISNLLDIIYHIVLYLNHMNYQNSFCKGVERLFALIMNSETPEIISLSCRIAKLFLKNLDLSGKSTENISLINSLYEKLGKIWTFQNRPVSKVQRNKKYNLIVQMNSPEIEYLFLVKALYYWEESHPTKLSSYKYSNITSSIEEEFSKNEFKVVTHKGREITYFNPLKSKLKKTHALEAVLNKRFELIRKETAELNVFLKAIRAKKEKEERMRQEEQLKKEKTEEAKKTETENLSTGANLLLAAFNELVENVENNILNIATSTEEKNKEPEQKQEEKVQKLTEEEILEKLNINKLKEDYLNRIIEHIKIAEKIGESASVRGFSLIECRLNKEEAESFTNLIYKSFYRLLPDIPNENSIQYYNSIEQPKEVQNLIDDNLLFPKFADKDLLLPGCTHILKETTKPYLNVSLVESHVYTKLDKTFKAVSEIFSKMSDDSQRRNFSTNLNDASLSEKILNEKHVSGNSMSTIMDDLMSLLYHTVESGNNYENEFIKKLKDSLKMINSQDWVNLDNQNKQSILGLLIVCSGFFKILKPGCKAIFNDNPEEICKIVAGGHGSGRTSVSVIFLKDKQGKIEKVNINSLKKISYNDYVLNLINIRDLMNSAIEIYSIEKENSDPINRSILLYILKILTNFDFTEDFAFDINKDSVAKLIKLLKEMTEDSKWIVNREISEVEYMDSWERLYSKLDNHSELFYSPAVTMKQLGVEQVQVSKQQNNPPSNEENDLISKFTLPDSTYISHLPQLVDMSKSTLALKNIQTFERYTVEEIFNYCKSNYRDYEYQMSLSQIRYHLSVGDIASAKGDISAIFDGTKVPSHMPLPREHRDMREVFKEECYPNNFYLLKLSSRVVRDTGIKHLIKQSSMGLNEVPVLLLLVDNSVNQSLVMYNDYEYSKIHTFWVNTDHLMLLENQMKLPATSFTHDYLSCEYLMIDRSIKKYYAKNVLTNLERSLLLNGQIDKLEELEEYINLVTWQNYKYNPINGVFRNFKNYIQIKKETEESNDLVLKRMISSKNKNLTIETGNQTTDINQILSALNSQPIQIDVFSNSTSKYSKSTYKKKIEEIEKLLNDLKINNQETVTLLKDWCLGKFGDLNKSFVKIKIPNLFAEYMRQFKEGEKKSAFKIGNMGNKLLALHELYDIDLNNFSGVVLSFDKTALLGPNAKLSFYSDPYGEHLIHEIIAVKNTRNNLESVVFNQPRVWLYYTPGTRAFYIHDWYVQSRDSELPCNLTFVPYTWSSLIWLTDYCTSNLFKNQNLESLDTFQGFTSKLLNLCTSLSLPAEIQMNIFNITNRVIMKGIKYVSMLEHMSLVNTHEMSIYEKFNIIGVDEMSVIQLIKNIDNCHSNETKEKSFSSSYVVNGVEIILSILAGIKESYVTLEMYFKENFDYSLPLWIEAIIKLGQFLNFLQGSSSLENNLMREIKDELSVYNMKQFNNIFVLGNIPASTSDQDIRIQVENILSTHNAKIVDKHKDIQIINSQDGLSKSVVFLTDGYNVDSLKEMVEETVVEPESSLWQCAFCEMENDMENEMCIFCEREKTVKVKEAQPKKKGLIRMEAYNYTVSDIISSIKNSLKNNDVLSSYTVKELVEKKQGEEFSQVQTEIKTEVKPVEKLEEVENKTKETETSEVVSTTLTENQKLENLEKVETQTYQEITKKNILTINSGDEYTSNPNLEDLINKFLKIRFAYYLSDKEFFTSHMKHIRCIPKLQDEINLINSFAVFTDSLQSNEEVSLLINDVKLDKAGDLFSSTNFIKLYKKLESHEIDLWMDNMRVADKEWNEINISTMEKIRELIDMLICKETNLNFVLPVSSIRFIPDRFNSLNHTGNIVLENNYPELLKYPLSFIRFYWSIIRYFNSCLLAALPFIKPPDMYAANENLEDKDYINIPFPKSISMFLSSAKGITFSYTKSNLIREVIASTEYSEEVVQIPSFKFERLQIVNNLQKSDQKSEFNKQPSFIRQGGEAEEYEEPSDEKELKNEESMFLQAYEQAKDLDPAFFRSKKAPGDPHIGFKVEFKGEYVQGIGGPYRQFFSDISLELQPKDYKNKKALRLLYPSSNNQAQKIDYKDKFVFTPGYNNNTALNHYEFLGILMGICIRTGVHVTLDLCSMIWKKIVK